ncbi:MurR/RpiR family transcriptional regulator [Shinella granuli]|uniref:RpiR family transcriptional regulator n=1 Tax=Shinella granuli TaxID=323621 RepID=A0A4R2C4D7_SHIGR|nr:MurR/RpiR family transcriptional regulator [Shinella granuli]TCN33519.1 RpiR family transcriptional regulator [Shinella granuli]
MEEFSSELRGRVEDFSGKLSKLDRQVIEALLVDPLGSSYETASEVAERAGVHQTTVIRFARKLGYDGFLEMRESLRKGHVQKASSASRVFSRIRTAGELSSIEAFLHSEIEALHQLPNHVRAADLESAATMLAKADRIMIFARGQAQVLGKFLALRLERLGFDAGAIDHIDLDTPNRIAGLKEGDVVISFALRRVPAQLPLLLSFCRRRRVRTLMISDMIGPSIRPSADILLAAPRGTETQSQTLSVPMAIANLLLLDLVQAVPQQARDALEGLDDGRVELEKLSRGALRKD